MDDTTTTCCSVEGCRRSIKTKKSGLCGLHYQRWYVHGDPSVVLPRDGVGPLLPRHVNIVGPDGSLLRREE